MIEAYVLCEAAVGKVKEALEQIKNIAQVECASAVVGPYDIIAYVESEDIKTLADVVIAQIHRVDGIKKTTTAIVVEL